MTTSGSSFQIPLRHRLRLRMRRFAPLLVWVVIALSVIPLYIRQESTGSLTGFATEMRYSAAAEQGGRLKRMEVELNQDISCGQIIAAFENEAVILQLQAARGELERLIHELAREEALAGLGTAELQIGQKMNMRRFLQDASIAQVSYLVGLAEQAQDRITLQGLELALDRTQKLGQQELASVAAEDNDRIAFEALNAKIDKQEVALAASLACYQAAESRVQDYQDSHLAEPVDAELLTRPLKSAIEVQKIRIEEVNLAISHCVLRAPATGRIVKISRYPGEVVAAGESVVSILVPHTTELVAYLPEQQILDLQAGDSVQIRRRADSRHTFTSSVASLGSGLEPIPRRTAPLDAAPSWGLSIFITLPQSMDVKPGEAFEISF